MAVEKFLLSPGGEPCGNEQALTPERRQREGLLKRYGELKAVCEGVKLNCTLHLLEIPEIYRQHYQGPGC
jgi:hypothetical protein